MLREKMYTAVMRDGFRRSVDLLAGTVECVIAWCGLIFMAISRDEPVPFFICAAIAFASRTAFHFYKLRVLKDYR